MYSAPRDPYDPHLLPRKPLSARRWMYRVLEHKGNSEAFSIRFSQAAEHVETREMRKPTMARFLYRIITDNRNIQNALEHLCSLPRSSKHEAGIWTRLMRGRFRRCSSYSEQWRTGTLRRGREYVREIPKANGGKRKIVVQSPKDRVFDRSCSQILSPALDSTFRHNSWAYRPERGCWHAIKKARSLIKEGYSHWVKCDVRDAFGSVSLPRLLEVLYSRLPDEALVELIDNQLDGSPVKGLRQGSPLSALMLNLYMDHFLDRPWHERHPHCTLIRYADDILIACRSKQEAKRCYYALVHLLRPLGMQLKETEAKAVIDLKRKRIEYLGFLLSEEDGKTTAIIAPKGIEKLRCKLEEAKQKNKELQRSLIGWLSYVGPAYLWHDRPGLFREVRDLFSAMDRTSEMLSEQKFYAVWKAAHKRYRKLRIHFYEVEV